MSLVESVRRAYERLGARGQGVLLAVSGGADSVALLGASCEVRAALKLRVEVATLDHSLRPEAVGEVAAVQRLCETLGVCCHARALGLAPGAGMEARAREARYAALEAIRVERRFELIATAHTANDQAETLLMRLGRGSSLRGAAGILERRGCVIRPLLGCTRAQTEAFVASMGVTPVRDPMNADARYERARIRLDALPALERAAGAPVVSQLASFAHFAFEDDAYLEALAEVAWSRVALGPGLLDRVGLLSLPPPLRRRALARLLSEAGVALRAATLAGAEAALVHGGRATLSRQRWLDSASGIVRVVGPARASALKPHVLSPGWHDVREVGLAFKRAGPLEQAPEPLCMPVGAGALAPFTVRARAPGDRVWTGRHTRKLQDLLVDLRVPGELRDQVPVVTQGDGRVIWLPGIWSSQQGAPVGFLLARPLTGGQAPEWLVRYRLVK